MRDGRILFAAAEERFTRVKLQDGFPWQALEAALDYTGLAAADIDCVTYPFFSSEEETRLFTKNLSAEREFIDDSDPSAPVMDLIRSTAQRVPERTGTIPGLGRPNPRHVRSRLRTESP